MSPDCQCTHQSIVGGCHSFIMTFLQCSGWSITALAQVKRADLLILMIIVYRYCSIESLGKRSSIYMFPTLQKQIYTFNSLPFCSIAGSNIIFCTNVASPPTQFLYVPGLRYCSFSVYKYALMYIIVINVYVV